MRRNAVRVPTGKLTGFGAVMGILALLGLSGPASAVMVGSVTIDGIRSAGEYTNGTSHGMESLLWFNNHRSIYTELAGNMNQLYWEINGAGSDWSLAMYAEVPTYARRMIWTPNCDYKTGSPTPSGCGGIPMDILDAYFEGTHHNSVKMDYETQTGSEYFEFIGPDICFGLQDDGGHCEKDTGATTYTNPVDDVTKNDGIFWQTSRHWVLANGCSLTECLKFDTAMSIEMLFRGLDSMAAAEALVASVTTMQLHLSDEARGLPPIIPPPQVPVPAAFWLFGTALIGFIGISRRTNLS